MRGKTSPMVIVVGAGPVGLATALSLHKRGVAVEIVERDDRPGTHSYALALHPRSTAMLKEWGILGSLQPETLQVKTLVYCDLNGPRYNLDLTKIPGQESGLLVMGQDHLEAALIAPLEKANVPIHWNSRLCGLDQSEDKVEVQLEKLTEGMSGYAMARLEWHVDREFTTRCRYLIGADGHFSMVRRGLGIDFPKVAPAQSFAVFEFKTDYAHNNEARIVYTDEGTNVMWPLPGGYCRWGFEIDESAAEKYSREKDRLFVQVGNQGYRTLESSMLNELLATRAPWFDGSIERFKWRMIVRFEKRLAPRFGRDHVWLAGDAGHVTGPVGMQSMNIGMKEGRELGNCVADCLDGGNETDILEAYNSEREMEWRALMGLSKHFSVRDETNSFLVNNVDKLFDSIPASINSLPQIAESFGMDLISV